MKLYCSMCHEPMEADLSSGVAHVEPCRTCTIAEYRNGYHNGYGDGKVYREYKDKKEANETL